MRAKKLSDVLVPPSRIASILDWRRSVGTVLGLDITADKIGIAITEHPENYCHSTPLGTVSLQNCGHQATTKTMGRGITPDSLSEIESIVRQNNVCAFVVNWPVNEGRMGEQCGKVLHVLDSILDQSDRVVTLKRPFTLWSTHEHVTFSSIHTDEWGRSPDFAKAPSYFPGMSYSSKNVLRKDSLLNESKVAASVLDEWIKSNWEIDFLMSRATAPKKVGGGEYYFSMQSVDEYQAPCLQSTLL